jgi:uncharacterized protein YbaR (Trm112 family)
VVDDELISMLACPETKQSLQRADEQLVEKINALIKEGKMFNRSQQKLTEPIDGGLICQDDQKYLYPIRDDIPILLTSEAIVVKGMA